MLKSQSPSNGFTTVIPKVVADLFDRKQRASARRLFDRSPPTPPYQVKRSFEFEALDWASATEVIKVRVY